MKGDAIWTDGVALAGDSDEEQNDGEAGNDAGDHDDNIDEAVLDELDDLFAMVAAQRRGEMLFAEELAKPDDEINFMKAAMYIAMHRRPDFSRVEDAETEIAELAAELETRLPPNHEDMFPLRTLKAIGRFMFDELGEEERGLSEEGVVERVWVFFCA